MSNAVHGRLTSILVNEFDLSRYLNKMGVNRDAPELDATTYQATAREYVADFPSCSVALEGFFSHDDTDLDTANDEFERALGVNPGPVITLCPEGNTFGYRALLQEAVATKHTIDAATTALITCMADFRGEVTHGVILAAKAARTATGNGTSVDNGASSANGGCGHQHVFAKSGTTPSLTTKIQHSADNSTFADLITFTAATTVTSERVTVTGTVNRYVRESRTISGTSPSFTNCVAFARF